MVEVLFSTWIYSNVCLRWKWFFSFLKLKFKRENIIKIIKKVFKNMPSDLLRRLSTVVDSVECEQQTMEKMKQYVNFERNADLPLTRENYQ